MCNTLKHSNRASVELFLWVANELDCASVELFLWVANEDNELRLWQMNVVITHNRYEQNFDRKLDKDTHLVVFKGGNLVKTTLSSRMLQNIEREQLRRQSHIGSMCHLLQLNNTINAIPVELLDHFIIDEENKLIYCYVPKIACTNWKRVFLALRNPENRDPLSFKGNNTHLPNMFRTLNDYTQTEVQKIFATYSTRFLFVRHPYERILSAYRNKFQNSYFDYFRKRFGTEIIKKHRKNPTVESLEKGHDVTFEEFLLYITSLSTQSHKVLFNEHWKPVYDLCFPCHVNYNVVGKYESLQSDAEYTLWKAGISDKVRFPTREQSYKQEPTANIMQNYYKNISEDILQKLIDIYKEDFLLFEYEHI